MHTCATTLSPKDSTVRVQIAVIMMRFCERYIESQHWMEKGGAFSLLCHPIRRQKEGWGGKQCRPSLLLKVIFPRCMLQRSFSSGRLLTSERFALQLAQIR